MEETQYRPDSPGPTGLFLDTSGLFARFYPGAPKHEEVVDFFESIAAGNLPYRPLVTNTYVLDELATLLVTTGTHEQATIDLQTLSDSEAVSVSREDEYTFETAMEAFLTCDDQQISYTDHYCAAEMNQRSIDHVLALDGDFETLGFTVLPRT